MSRFDRFSFLRWKKPTSVTQKIASVEDYDQIVLLMEGEVTTVIVAAELVTLPAEFVTTHL